MRQEGCEPSGLPDAIAAAQLPAAGFGPELLHFAVTKQFSQHGVYVAVYAD